MVRALLAIPAVAVASLSAYRASANNTPQAKLPETARVPPTIPSVAETVAQNPQPQQKRRPKRHTMPARFQLENDEELARALHRSPPPIGEATLHSGLGVEIATW